MDEFEEAETREERVKSDALVISIQFEGKCQKLQADVDALFAAGLAVRVARLEKNGTLDGLDKAVQDYNLAIIHIVQNAAEYLG